MRKSIGKGLNEAAESMVSSAMMVSIKPEPEKRGTLKQACGGFVSGAARALPRCVEDMEQTAERGEELEIG